MLLLIAVLTVFRLWFATTFELTGDEAYYRLWAKNLDWCYYSKGPLVAWTIALGTTLFGDTVFGIRFFAVILAAATSFLLYRLGRTLYSPRVGLWAVLVWNVSPLAVPGTLLMTIDPLSIFFWTAAALAFWRVRGSQGTLSWAAVGLLVGLGMLGKYTNVALLPGFALFCLLERRYRHHLARPTFWLMVATTIACLVPVAVWNHRRG
ncbi:MAG: glycosyltransferase family 39 protein, partial [Kiritimatiellae bacterium]|nr:glycosyltransferase family 39 protein [Kiritimatiellia bacterium]